VYLDTEERRRFAQKGHEYLIEQIQHTGADTIASTVSAQTQSALVRLSYNHPVKELIWCYTNPNYNTTSNYNSMWNFSSNCANVNVTTDLGLFQSSNNFVLPHHIGAPHIYTGCPTLQGTYSAASTSLANVYWSEDGVAFSDAAARLTPRIEVGPLANFKLILNGQDRFAAQPGKYFNLVQPFYYHTGNPYPGIYCYSFALQPEEHQPTGTCNFSRIDNAQVQVVLKPSVSALQQRMFAVNYNILRIQSGMGGLAFSN
jgi:hypothetical protein